MASSYCTVYVGNLPENVTSKQLGERFNHAFKDMKVVHSEVVNKAGKTYGFVVYPLSGDSTHGEQYLEKESMVKKCQNIFNNTSWQGSRITVEEGREHYIYRLKREKIESKNTARLNAKKVLKATLNAPLPSTDGNLRIKSKLGKGYISISRNPMPWSYKGKEILSRRRTYKSDSDDEEKEDEQERNMYENNQNMNLSSVSGDYIIENHNENNVYVKEYDNNEMNIVTIS